MTPNLFFEDIIYNILSSYYTINSSNEDIINFFILSFLKNFIYTFNEKKIGFCLIQELDKIHLKKIHNDVVNYKFLERDRIIVSKFVNKINSVFKNE